MVCFIVYSLRYGAVGLISLFRVFLPELLAANVSLQKWYSVINRFGYCSVRRNAGYLLASLRIWSHTLTGTPSRINTMAIYGMLSLTAQELE